MAQRQMRFRLEKKHIAKIQELEGIDALIRLRVNWECERLDDVFLYAAYIGDAAD